jgi:hypothetical protein
MLLHRRAWWVMRPPNHLGGHDYDARMGRITLTMAQKEAAAIAGISQAEYALQLVRLREEKAQGFHGGGGQ